MSIGLINIVDKTKATELSTLGYHYTEKNIDNKVIYEFIATKELIQVLNSKFDKGSFFMSKNMNF